MDDDLMVERYLDGAMSPEEQSTFTSELKTRPELQRLLDAERVVRQAVRRAGISAPLSTASVPSRALVAALQQSHFRPNPFTFARLGLSVAALGIAAFVIAIRQPSAPTPAPTHSAPIVRAAADSAIPAPALAVPYPNSQVSQTADAELPTPTEHPSRVMKARTSSNARHRVVRDLDDGLNKPPVYMKDSVPAARLHTN